MITDRTLNARRVLALPAERYVDEVRAFIDAIDPRGHVHVAEITYDVVDCPLIRITRQILDEHGACLIDEATGDVAVEQYDVPITAPLPTWWRPAS